MADLQVTNELCKEAYATWCTKDERAELNQEFKNFDASKNLFNDVHSKLKDTKDQKAKDALYRQLMALEEEIKQKEITVELKNKKLEKEMLAAKHNFENMTPAQKSMAAKEMRDSGYSKSNLITKDMQKAIEVFAERNLDAQLAQQRSEEAQGKQVGVKDTLVVNNNEEEERKVVKSLKRSQKDIEKQKEQSRDFERTLKKTLFG